MSENESGSAAVPGSAPRQALGGTARTTAWLALGTATSRALGLVRTILLGTAIGVTGSVAADAFAVANKLPNVMFAVAAAGVLNSALRPQIVRSFHQGSERTVHRILTLGGFYLLVGTTVLTVMAGLWVRVFSVNWGPEQTALATAFALWCIPQLFFYGMYTLFGQVLNSREQFGPFMWAPVANNIVAIAGLAVYLVIFGPHAVGGGQTATLAADWTPGRIALLAGVATLGIAAQAAVLIPPMLRGGYRWRWVWSGPKGELLTVAKVASWALGAVLIEQAAVLFTTRFATAATEQALPGDESVAGVAGYDYALSIYLLPHSLVTVSLATILFTRLARHAADNNMGGVREVLTGGMRSIGTFTVFATAALVVFAPHLVRVLAPASSPETVAAVALVVQCLALGLVPLGASVLVKQTYFALEDGKGVFLIHIPMAVAWITVGWLAREFTEPQWWVPGVALGLSVSNAVALTLRAWGLRRRLGGLDMRRVGLTHLKALAAAVMAAGAGLLVLRVGPDSYASQGGVAVAQSLATAAVGGLVMVAVYLAGAWLLRLTEVGDMVRTLLRRPRGNVR